jgi:MoaA/NifB/PqqE/SkfB family radical SAM enzyme
VIALVDEVLGLGGLSRVILSGQGEPLTHPEVYTLIEAIRSRGVAVTVITNLIAGELARLLASSPDELLVGVHAASAESYRAFHPGCAEGAFAELLRRLDALVAAGRRGDKHVQVICGVNAHELPAMVRLAHEHGAGRISFKLASLAAGTEPCALDERGRRRLTSEGLPAARVEAEALGVRCNLEVLAAQLATGGTDTAPIEEVGCFMGYLYARVLVDGTVLFCCADEIVVGSLAEASFPELWRGPAWQALRRRLREGRYFPACRRCGKLNQNLKTGRRFAARYGEQRRREVCGRGEP